MVEFCQAFGGILANRLGRLVREVVMDTVIQIIGQAAGLVMLVVAFFAGLFVFLFGTVLSVLLFGLLPLYCYGIVFYYERPNLRRSWKAKRNLFLAVVLSILISAIFVIIGTYFVGFSIWNS